MASRILTKSPISTPAPVVRLLESAGIHETEYWRTQWRINECVYVAPMFMCPDLETKQHLEHMLGPRLCESVGIVRFDLLHVKTPKPLPPSVLKKHTPQKFWS